MRFSPMAALACLMCVGILYLGMNGPQQSRLDADEITQEKQLDSIAAIEQVVEALKGQSNINVKLIESDNRTTGLIESLQQSIARLGEHVKDSVPTREEVTRLVSAKSDAVASDGECTCGEKLADLQRQIDDLKTKLATLECQCASASTAKPASAAATSSYGTTSGPVVLSSGGSTGSVKSGGSTGMVRSSYGSTGSTNVQYSPQFSTVQYSQPVYSQPVEYSVSSPVVVSETVVTTSESDGSGCYIDENGNKVCPLQSQSQPRLQRTFFPNLRRRN